MAMNRLSVLVGHVTARLADEPVAACDRDRRHIGVRAALAHEDCSSTASSSSSRASSSTSLSPSSPCVSPSSPLSSSSSSSSSSLSVSAVSGSSGVSGSYAISYSDVLAASRRLKGVAHVTPVMECRAVNDACHCRVFLKCENMQKIGAFKFRGAYNSVTRLLETGELTASSTSTSSSSSSSSSSTSTSSSAKRGVVVTHSSGNHAQALALAARLSGISAHIVMPNNSSAVKVRAVKGYGATVYECEPNQASRESTAQRILDTNPGAVLIPPYDYAHVMAGQGTAALELIDQVKQMAQHVDAIVVPVGGGGLLSGVCIAARGVNPSIRIFAAEPVNVNDCAQSMRRGERVLLSSSARPTIADGLRTSLGELTWPIIRDHVTAVIEVEEDDIRAAMRLVYERVKIVIEPSSAVAVAAIMAPSFQARLGDLVPANQRPRPAHVAAVLSGGNVDLQALTWA